MLLCVHTCVVTLETPLSGVAQANRLRPHTTQQEDRRTGTLLHGCHLQIKKLYKVKRSWNLIWEMLPDRAVRKASSPH